MKNWLLIIVLGVLALWSGGVLLAQIQTPTNVRITNDGVNGVSVESVGNKKALDVNVIGAITGTVKIASTPTGSISGILSAPSDSIVLPLQTGSTTIGVEVSGTWVGQLELESSVSGSIFVSHDCQSNAGTITNATAGNGTFFCQTAGLTVFKVRASSLSSGSASVAMRDTGGAHIVNAILALGSSVTTSANVVTPVSGTITVANPVTDLTTSARTTTPVSGTVSLSNQNPAVETGLAKDATLTGGTQIAIASSQIYTTSGNITSLTTGSVVGPLVIFGKSSVCGISISGTHSGITLVMEGSLDNALWYTMSAQAIIGNSSPNFSIALGSNATAYLISNCVGVNYLRTRATAYSSGTANVTISGQSLGISSNISALAWLQAGTNLIGRVTGSAENITPVKLQGTNSIDSLPTMSYNALGGLGTAVPAVAELTGGKVISDGTITGRPSGVIDSLNMDTSGRTYVRDYAASLFSCIASGVTATTQCQALSGGNRLVITDIALSTSATQTNQVSLVAGVGTNCGGGNVTNLTMPIYLTQNPAGPGTFVWPLRTPIVVPLSNAICCKSASNIAFGCMVNGHIAPP